MARPFDGSPLRVRALLLLEARRARRQRMQRAQSLQLRLHLRLHLRLQLRLHLRLHLGRVGTLQVVKRRLL
jgi:hypothetical protein